MDRAKALALLPVITAYANGLTIQHKSLVTNSWVDITVGGPFEVVNFSDSTDRYRVKPSPKRLYEITNSHEYVVLRTCSKEDAERHMSDRMQNGIDPPYTLRTYVEVLEDGT